MFSGYKTFAAVRNRLKDLINKREKGYSKEEIENLLGKFAGSKTFKWDGLAKAVADTAKKNGSYNINLTVGQPNVPVAQEVLEELKIQANENFHGYVEHHGISNLKDAILEYVNKKNVFGFELENTSQIIVGPAKALVFLAMKVAAPNANDTVLLPNPSWVSYEPMLDALHLHKEDLHLDPTDYTPGEQFKKELEAKKGARALLLNSPSNPVGNVFSREQLKEISEIYSKNLFGTVISDEVYHELVFDGEHHSIAEFIPERTIVIDSFSKSAAAPGWRIGYAVSGDPDLIKRMMNLNSNVFGGTSSVVQAAMVKAFKGGVMLKIEDLVKDYKKRRDVILRSLIYLNTLKNLKYKIYIPKPAGAFYIFPKFCKGEDIKNPLSADETEKFATDLCSSYYVGTVPGHEFGTVGAGCLRLSYGSAGPKQLIDAARRIGLLMLSLKEQEDNAKKNEFINIKEMGNRIPLEDITNFVENPDKDILAKYTL